MEAIVIDACGICSRPGIRRKIYLKLDGRKRREWRTICDACVLPFRKRKSASKRGRNRDRVVPAPTADEWITALRRSWLITGDCFRCELSGMKLDLDSAHTPLALTCDHDPPGTGRFLVVAWIINDMKNDHNRAEFYRNVTKLATIIKDGSPNSKLADEFRPSFAKIEHWRRTVLVFEPAAPPN